MHDPNDILARNLRALMVHHDMISITGEPNQSELSRKAGISQRSAGRVINCENSATLDMVARICSVFRLDAWQILTPHFDPADPPIAVIKKSQN